LQLSEWTFVITLLPLATRRGFHDAVAMLLRGLRCLLILSVLFAPSCKRETTAPPKPIHITSTVFPLAQIARQIGLDRVTTQWVLERPADVQSFLPSDRDRELIRAGDLLLINGSIDAWAVHGRDLQDERGIIRMNVIFPAENVPKAALWLDPEASLGLADVIHDRLRTRSPLDADRLSAARDVFKQSVRDLQHEFMTPLQKVRGMKVGTLSSVYDALLARYALQPLRLSDVSLQQLTDAQLAEIKRLASGENVKWLVADASLPDGLIDLIQSRTGLTVLRLEVLGSSAQNSPVHTYIEICRYNLTQLSRLK